MVVFGEELVELNAFLTRYLNEVKGYISSPSHFSAGERPLLRIECQTKRVPEMVWVFGKQQLPRTKQKILGRYIHYTNRRIPSS